MHQIVSTVQMSLHADCSRFKVELTTHIYHPKRAFSPWLTTPFARSSRMIAATNLRVVLDDCDEGTLED